MDVVQVLLMRTARAEQPLEVLHVGPQHVLLRRLLRLLMRLLLRSLLKFRLRLLRAPSHRSRTDTRRETGQSF